MTARVEEAIYKMGVTGKEQVDAAAASVDKLGKAEEGLTVAQEKVTRSTRTTTQGFDRFLASLDKRVASEQRLQREIEKIERFEQAGIGTTGQRMKALDQVVQRYLEQMKAIDGVRVSNDNLAKSQSASVTTTAKMGQQIGLARHEMVNLSRQVQDVGTMLAMGASPMQVLTSQGAQVYDIFASSTGTLKGFGQQLLAMVTPARALALGVTAVGAGVVAAAASWRSFALSLDDTARRAGITVSEMAKLQAVASFKGIAQQESAEGFGGFAAQVFQAQRGRGSLAEQFKFAGIEARTFNDYLMGAAELIRRAQTDQERLVRLQDLGLPATMQWVRLLQGGANGLRAASLQAAEFGGPDTDRMIDAARRFDEAWDKAWTNFGLYARAAAGNAVRGLEVIGDGIGGVIAGGRSLGEFLGKAIMALRLGPGGTVARADRGGGSESEASTKPVSPGFGPNGESLADFKQRLTLEQQRVGVLGQLATVEDQVRQQENALEQIRRTTPKSLITPEDERRILEFTKLQALGVIQIRQQADAMRVEAATVGMSAGAAAAYRAEQERINEFRQRGIELSPSNVRMIREEARALGEVTQIAAQLQVQQRLRIEGQTMFLSDADKRIAQELVPVYGTLERAMQSREAMEIRSLERWKEMKEAANGLVSGIGAAVLQGKSLTDVLRNNATNVFGRYIDKQLEQGINASLGLAAKGTGGLAPVSTGMMTVTTNSVMIGGPGVTMAGLGGLPGVVPPVASGMAGNGGASASAAFSWTQGGNLLAASQAIKNIESGGGNYAALGPITKSGDRAYGAYQVMGANIPSWSQSALGYSMTPQQFLADPRAQDAIFQHRFGGYMDKYGNRAASAWFAGEGGMKNAGATDQLGTSVAAYQSKFDAQMKGVGNSLDMAANKAQAFGTNITTVGTATQTAATTMQVSAMQIGQIGSAVGSMVGIVGASLSKSPVAKAIFMGATPLLSLLGKGLFTSLMGFDDGGYTGPGARGVPRGIVHAGEVVFSQDDVARGGGVGAVEAMRRRGGPPVIAARGGSPINIRGGDIVIHGNVGPDQMDEIRQSQTQQRAALAEIAQRTVRLESANYSRDFGPQLSH